MEIVSFAWYGGLVLLVFLVILFGEESGGELKALSSYIVFFLLLLFCGLRNGVGNDYLEYSRNFDKIYLQELGFSEQRFEPFFYYLSIMFGGLANRTAYIMLSCSAVTFFFLFKVLRFHSIMLEGLIIFISLGFMFMINDQVRQGVALCIFLFSLRFVEMRDFKTYFFYILLGSLCHYTALLMLPLYWVTGVKISRYISVPVLLCVYLGYKIGVFYDLFFAMIKLIPIYGDIYADHLQLSFIRDQGSGLGILFLLLVSLYVCFSTDSNNKMRVNNIFFLGAVLTFMSVGFMPIQRIALYLFSSIIIILGQYLKGKRYSLEWSLAMFFIGLYFSIGVLFDLEKHGAVPYSNLLFP